MDESFKKLRDEVVAIALELALQTKEVNQRQRPRNKPFHDGMAYYQYCMDEEWERWEKDATGRGSDSKFSRLP